MPYYKDLNILFIYIPKTGGSSIEDYLKTKNSGQQYLYSGKGNRLISNQEYQQYSLQHQFYSTLYKYRDELAIDFNATLSVISIVRNPYNRLISGLLWKKMITKDSSRKEVSKAAAIYIAHDNLDNHNTAQYKFLINESGKLYEQIQIFRTETLTQNMKAYGFHDYAGQKMANTYWQFYSQELLDVVNQFYEKDFEYFGYTQVMYLPFLRAQITLLDQANNS